MRSPPVCCSRLVGLRNSRDWSGCSRSTRMERRRPKAVMSSGEAFSGGNCSRVREATPLSLWHMRHWAFSRMGNKVRLKFAGDCPHTTAAKRKGRVSLAFFSIPPALIIVSLRGALEEGDARDAGRAGGQALGGIPAVHAAQRQHRQAHRRSGLAQERQAQRRAISGFRRREKNRAEDREIGALGLRLPHL